MTLSRLTNYVDGNVLTGAQLNNEFDNILNNGPSLVSASIPSASIVQGLTGSIISNLGTFAANAYQLRSTSTIVTLVATSAYSINTQTAGPIAGGRDQAAVFASTDVHFYAITTGGTSTNAAGICSTRPPTLGPTLPAGYSAWGYLISAKYSTASSAVAANGRISGAYVALTAPKVALSSGTAETDTTVLVSSAVPNVATAFHLNITEASVLSAAAGTAVTGDLLGVSDMASNTLWFAQAVGGSTATGAVALSRFNAGTGATIRVPNYETTASFQYSFQLNTATSGHASMNVAGYTCPNGDVG